MKIDEEDITHAPKGYKLKNLFTALKPC